MTTEKEMKLMENRSEVNSFVALSANKNNMNVKTAKKMMKKRVELNSYLSVSHKDKKGREVFTAEFYKIEGFESQIKLRHGQEVNMISNKLGIAVLNGDKFVVKINDKFFTDYLKALNIDPVTVKLFMVNDSELTFNIHSEKIESSKKVLDSINLLSIVYNSMFNVEHC